MKLSAIAGTAGGGGGDGIRLAPGNTVVNNSYGAVLGAVVTNPINCSAGLTQVMNLTGPGVVTYARLTTIPVTSATHTIKLTIDGEVVVNSSFTAGLTTMNLIASMVNTGGSVVIKYNTSFILEYSNVNATGVVVEYQALRTQ